MKSNSSRSLPSQVILGGFVIALGVLFLLDNLDIVDVRRMITFWPAVFVLLGVVKLLDSTSPNGKVFGSALIGVGVLMTLNRLGVLHFQLRAAWPLLLIAVGGVVIFKALAGRKALENGAMAVEKDSDAIVDITAILGGFDRRITTQNFRGGEVTAFMGGCMLDLRGSSIEGEAVINVFVGMGGISLKVPTDWTVIMHGTPIMGGFDEKTSNPPNGSKRLIVKGYAIMGGVEIRN
jgi:predicted membrane protein